MDNVELIKGVTELTSGRAVFMLSNVDDHKNSIRDYLKVNKDIETMLGCLTVDEEIGQGGNALVYSANWGKSKVAVKVLAEDCSQTRSSRYLRFLTEIKEIILLSDTQAVVPIYFMGHLQANNEVYPYMVMKKYPLTLSEWKKKNNIDNLEVLLNIIKQLLYCIDVIHNNNIVHRDLKPQNILIDDSNEIVVSDFGISWFDPNHYERLVKTERRERLANFGFSAPEQFHLNPDPKPTMDLFALGQIIQWLVTDIPSRGLGRELLSSYNDSFAPLDNVVDKLLQQDPKNRPQDINEVQGLLNSSFNPPERMESEEEIVLKALRKFDEILRLACPGKTGVIRVTDKEKINDVLEMLAENADVLRLWWTQGSSNCPINNHIRKLDEDTWIIDYGEHRIEEMWIKKDGYSLDHQYILLQCAPMPSFGIYGNQSYKYEEAAWFNDRYITRGEYDDGVAEIDNKSVVLNGKAELRTRELERDYMFIGTAYHPINIGRNDDIVDKLYHHIEENGVVVEEELRILDKLKLHPTSLMMQ